LAITAAILSVLVGAAREIFAHDAEHRLIHALPRLAGAATIVLLDGNDSGPIRLFSSGLHIEPTQPPIGPSGPGERANAQLKSWRILRKLRCCPDASDAWPRPSTCYRTTKPPPDEKAHYRYRQ